MNVSLQRTVVSQPVLTSPEKVKAIRPLTVEDKRRLRDIAAKLKPHRRELLARLALIATEALSPACPSRDDAERLAARVLDSFFRHAARGELGKFVGDLLEIGHDLAPSRPHGENASGLDEPASAMLLLHCLEQVVVARLIEANGQPNRLHGALAALGKLLHNSRSRMWANQANDALRLAAELRDQARAVEAERRRREEFMSLVTHEFRGPLSVIIGYAQLISKAVEKGARIDPEMITQIWDQGHRLAELVDVLADVSHIESGRFEIARSRTDVVAVVSRVVREFEWASERHRLVLAERVRPILGNWDAGRLGQALFALVDKAIKFSPSGGTIEVSVKRANSEVRITVAVDKVELPPDDLPGLFQPFSEVFRHLPVRETGLDLYIAKGIVKAHGGMIWVEEIVGGGCCFGVLLPLK